MQLSDFFLDPSIGASFVHGHHHPGLVLLSIFVSVFSATMALQTAQIAQRTENALYRHIAIATGALALGGGVWTTHFIGMLAFELPTQVRYSTGLTLVSVLPACAASWFALRMLSMARVSGRRFVGSGTLVGLGIGAMHYSGMAAMQTPLEMRYEPIAFSLSIFVAVGLAILALWVRYGLLRTSLGRIPRLLISGAVLGLAIASMHYTGMAAVRFIGEPGVADSGVLLNTTYVSFILSSFVFTVTIMVVAVNGLIRSQELFRRMEEGSSRLRATLDTAVDGIITIDSSGIVQDFNHSAERLFGWKAEEVIGRNIKMLMPEPYQSAHDGYLHNYMTTGKAKIIGNGREVTGLRKDGSHMPMRLAVGRVDLPGELLFVGFVTDISDRHGLEASLRETAERAEQAAAAKSTFLANMSHEIRTPMNSIIGFTELLLQSDLTAVQRNHLNTVRQASRSLLRLLNDILDTTKMEKGRLELESTDFSLKGLAMQIESSMRLAAQAKHLTLSTHYPTDMPVHFRGDPLRVLQVLTNLVGNAIKFTETGGIDVVFARDSDIVHVQVRDTGIGMTQQQVESIFAPFTQADASISRRFGGTGLGTTIARQLVELMGGEIDVESAAGQGSIFHVRLPLPVGQAPAACEPDPAPLALPPLNILIADDVPQNLELLALTLEAGGHRATMAQDGNEALERFAEGNFDVVLMDVHMPGIDGLQATRLIRQYERTHGARPTPILALTASVMEEDRRAALQAGMDGFALKPLDVPNLFGEIARVLDAAPPSEAVEDALQAATAQAGIDWRTGVSLWGDRDRLAGALHRFLSSLDDKYPLPPQAGSDTDLQQLRFSLHGMRGAAANLALPAVAALAGEMEDLLRAGHEDEVLQRIPALRERLAKVRREVAAEADAYDALDRSAESFSAPSVPAQADSSLVLSLQALQEVMASNELDDGLLDTVCRGLETLGERKRASELRAALDAFEFREAAALLDALIAEHGCPAITEET